MAQAQKLEITLDFYKQKYEDCGKLSDTVTELEAKQEHQHSKINDQEKENDGLKTKVKKYMDQYGAEKDKNINLELTITKKDAELEILRNENKRFETSIFDLESRVHDQQKQMELYKNELEDTSHIYQSNEKALAQASQTGNNSASILEQDSLRKPKKFEKSAEEESEKELLQKDNELLSEKCKVLQKENEQYKLKIENEFKKHIDSINRDNENLKEEIKKLKINIASNQPSLPQKEKEDHINENAKLLQEIEILKQVNCFFS